jgi:alkanesulfonate monooxygenase
MKVLWYLNLADGKYPWIENGLYPVDFDRYRRLAETIDRGGFFGALVATWPNDPFISASFAASYTERMRFLVAVYARMTPAKLLAQQALTFDVFTGDRLLMNLINGRDNIMETYGVTTSHDDRYALGEALLEGVRSLLRCRKPEQFPQCAARDHAGAKGRNPAMGGGRQHRWPRSRRKGRRRLPDDAARR